MTPLYRLLFLDVDGTLVCGGDAISEEVKAALRAAEAAGCLPILCTGRTRYRAQPIADQMAGAHYGVLLNGALIYDWQARKTLARNALTPEIAEGAARIAHALELAPLCFAVEEDDRWVYTEPLFADRLEFTRVFTERMRYVEALDWSRFPPPVSMETYGTLERLERLVATWREAFGAEIVTYLWYSHSYQTWGAHIHSSAVNKAHGAQQVAARLGVPQAATLAVGDEVNDVELLKWAGCGVAMGNAHESAKSAADYVTSSCIEQGVAQAVAKFVLGAQR